MSSSVKPRSGSIELKSYNYGKSFVRLVKVERGGSRHEVKEINVDIQLFGAFEAAYWEGDNRLILPTDSMRNTVYSFARREPIGEIEEFGRRLADHFLLSHSHVNRVQIAISENDWRRIECNGSPHNYAFQMMGPESRVAVIDRARSGTSIKAGIKNLFILKTALSTFENFLRDEYTTLKEARDRLLCTTVRAEWSYLNGRQNFGEIWRGVRTALIEIFADHESRSVQHTLCAMGEGVLREFKEIDEIRLSMPNRHCLLADLSPFNQDNPNEVFVPTDEPSGLIEATLRRSGENRNVRNFEI